MPYPPICLDLALGTRVCAVRVDAVRDLIDTVRSFVSSSSLREALAVCVPEATAAERVGQLRGGWVPAGHMRRGGSGQRPGASRADMAAACSN